MINSLKINQTITKSTYSQILKELDNYQITITKLDENEIEIVTRGTINHMRNTKSFEQKVIEFMDKQEIFNTKVTKFMDNVNSFIKSQIEFNNRIEKDIKDIKSCPTIAKELKSIH